MASKIEAEVEVKSSADKFWGGIRDSTELFPKIFPEQYKSIEITEGDGKSVGTVRLVTYAEGFPIITFAKERIDVAEEEQKLVAYSVIEGELTNYFKTFKATLQVLPKGECALVKWTVEYDKATAEVPEPDIIKETAVKTFNDLDAYLLKN